MSEETTKPEGVGTQDDPIFLTNLNVKAIGCNPRLASGSKGPILIARMWGVAFDTKAGEDKRTGNAWVALAGEFAAQNLQEGTDHFGKTYRSGKLFLPAGIQEIVEKAIAEMKKDAASSGSVRFAVELAAAPATNASGYTYQMKSLMKPTTVDPLNDIAAALPEPTVKLPSPKQIAAAAAPAVKK